MHKFKPPNASILKASFSNRLKNSNLKPPWKFNPSQFVTHLISDKHATQEGTHQRDRPIIREQKEQLAHSQRRKSSHKQKMYLPSCSPILSTCKDILLHWEETKLFRLMLTFQGFLSSITKSLLWWHFTLCTHITVIQKGINWWSSRSTFKFVYPNFFWNNIHEQTTPSTDNSKHLVLNQTLYKLKHIVWLHLPKNCIQNFSNT